MLRSASIRDSGAGPLVMLFILNAVDEFDRAVLAVALDSIREEFNLSDATVGLLPLAVVFITGLLALPAGNWADRWSRKHIVAIGAMVWGAAGLLAAAAQSFTQLFFTRALLGAGQGTIGPTHGSLLSDYYPVSIRGRVLGYHRAANPLGQVLGAVIGGVIVASVGWRWGFAAAAIPGLILGLLALKLREPNRGEADFKEAAATNPLLKEFLTDPEDKWGFFRSLGTIWRNRTLRYLILTNAAFGFMLTGVVFWIPAFFERRYEFSQEGAALALAALALAAFFGTWYGGPIADRFLQRGFTFLSRVGLAALVFLTLTWAAAFAVPSSEAAMTFLFVGAFVASLGIPGVINIVAAASPPHIRAQAFAAFGLALAVCGAAVAPVVVGAISEVFQAQYDMTRGEGLQVGLVLATVGAGALGSWLMYLATRHAAADVQRTMGEFLQQQADRARRRAEAGQS
jgi:MFS transporter, Spinster family, sphingosine-1-phosphate transporter